MRTRERRVPRGRRTKGGDHGIIARRSGVVQDPEEVGGLAVEQHWEQADLEDRLHLERFSLKLSGDGGEGGTITFRTSGKSAEADGATTVLEAGEAAGVGMPFGCRMGICHTCTLTLVEGTIRDLRNGDEYDQPNEQVQTCTTAACGDVVLNI